MNRRSFIGTIGALAALGRPGLSYATGGSVAHVVVVGGGYGGATAAKYVRLFSQGKIAVTLIDPNPAFISCPISNLVLEGKFNIDDVTTPYTALDKNHDITRIQDSVTKINADAKTVTLSDGEIVKWDRLIVSPGIDFMWERIPGMNKDGAQEQVLHAWKPGDQTVGLRKQLEAMDDGGRFIIAIPEAPYRCPPAPYERASLVASYFKKHKPRSKVHVFDANADITSKAGLFRAAWAELYPDIIDYFPTFKAVDVVASENRVIFEFGEEETADVLNFVPPMQAGNLAKDNGLVTANDRWCEVDFLTFESIAVPGVHVLGDAIQIAPAMPKSGHMANQHGKTCAAAVAAMLLDQPINADPIYSNTCFSFVSDTLAMHVASVHRYDPDKKTMLSVAGSGGVSATSTQAEAEHALSWSKAIWTDMLA